MDVQQLLDSIELQSMQNGHGLTKKLAISMDFAKTPICRFNKHRYFSPLSLSTLLFLIKSNFSSTA